MHSYITFDPEEEQLNCISSKWEFLLLTAPIDEGIPSEFPTASDVRGSPTQRTQVDGRYKHPTGRLPGDDGCTNATFLLSYCTCKIVS